MLSLYRQLLPGDDKFIAGFIAHAETASRAARVFSELADAPRAERRQYFDRLRKIEEEADAITVDVIQRVHRVNIGPFDREDIHNLITAEDDIVDLMKKAAWHIVLYQVEPVAEMRSMISCIERAVAEIGKLLPMLLRISQNAEAIKAMCGSIGDIESEADDLLRQGQSRLFPEDTPPRPENVFPNQVLEFIEDVVDRCEDLADIVESIVIKSA